MATEENLVQRTATSNEVEEESKSEVEAFENKESLEQEMIDNQDMRLKNIRE